MVKEMVDENPDLDIPLADEIDMARSKSARTRRVLMLVVLVTAVLAAVIWWQQGKRPSLKMDIKGTLPEKTGSFNFSRAGNKGLFGQPAGVKKRLIMKAPVKVTNLQHLKEGKRLYKKRELDKAEAEYTEGMKHKGHQEIIINNLGVILFSRGKLIESAEMFKKALESSPLFPDAHFNLAYVSEKMGNKNRSFYHYRRFIELSQERHRSLVKKLKKRMGKLN